MLTNFVNDNYSLCCSDSNLFSINLGKGWRFDYLDFTGTNLVEFLDNLKNSIKNKIPSLSMGRADLTDTYNRIVDQLNLYYEIKDAIVYILDNNWEFNSEEAAEEKMIIINDSNLLIEMSGGRFSYKEALTDLANVSNVASTVGSAISGITGLSGAASAANIINDNSGDILNSFSTMKKNSSIISKFNNTVIYDTAEDLSLNNDKQPNKADLSGIDIGIPDYCLEKLSAFVSICITESEFALTMLEEIELFANAITNSLNSMIGGAGSIFSGAGSLVDDVFNIAGGIAPYIDKATDFVATTLNDLQGKMPVENSQASLFTLNFRGCQSLL